MECTAATFCFAYDPHISRSNLLLPLQYYLPICRNMLCPTGLQSGGSLFSIANAITVPSSVLTCSENMQACQCTQIQIRMRTLAWMRTTYTRAQTHTHTHTHTQLVERWSHRCGAEQGLLINPEIEQGMLGMLATVYLRFCFYKMV